jgi:hypothetical protein
MTAPSIRQNRAQSIIETVVGVMVLIPIVLFLLDIAVLVMANTANDNLAKSACRAAASATDGGTPPTGTTACAQSAAQAVCSAFATPSIIIQGPGGGGTNGGSMLTGFYFNARNSSGGSWPGPLQPGQQAPPQPAQGQVGVITTMVVTLPVPFPGLSKFTFLAQAVEPIVSVVPDP